MPVNQALVDLGTLSRLLDEAMDIAPARLDSWLLGVSATHPHLVRPLRRMLDEHQAPGHPSFLMGGPHLPDAIDPASKAGERLGPYRLVREIGRGGMASVWIAERKDGNSVRTVALKMPLMTLTGSADVRRFERERDLLGLLTHPRIAQLYDAGVTDGGRPYLVIEYVPGVPITDACNARQLDVPARLSLFIDVLSAISHAHKHLVVHRDIKPSNVFVHEDGQIKLLDFGIARLLDDRDGAVEASPLTREGGWALTPQYAAPEQVSGQPISTATDVYALGVLLYELLAGTSPHPGMQRSMAETIDAVLHAEPLPPSRAAMAAGVPAARGVPEGRLRTLLQGDLDTVVLKALRKVPGERYGSAEAFADDLRRYLRHLPVAARPPSPLHRAGLFARRHRAASVGTAVGIVALVVFGLTATRQYAQTLAERTRADTVRDFMVDMVGDAEPDETQQGSEVTGKQIVEKAVERARAAFAGQPELRAEVLGALGRISGKIGEDERAAQLLDESLGLMAHRPDGDASLNEMRAQRAVVALDARATPLAKSLAQQAFAGCSASGRECAQVRAVATNTLSKVAAMDGDVDKAIDWMKATVRYDIAGYGERDLETAMAFMGLAVVQRNAGRLVDASATLQQAEDIARGVVLRSSDRQNMQRLQAVLDLDLGRFESARHRFEALLATPLDRQERMLQLRFLADAELATGSVSAASAHAEEGISLAATADARGGRLIFLRQTRARVAALQSRHDAARSTIDAVLGELELAGFTATSSERLRARRYRGEILARAGDLHAARDELERTVADHARLAAPLAIELGQTLDLLGTVLRAEGDGRGAAALHAKARTLYGSAWPADHPYLARNDLYAAAALDTADHTDASRRHFDDVAGRYLQRMGAGSIWAASIEAATQRCQAGGRPCLLAL